MANKKRKHGGRKGKKHHRRARRVSGISGGIPMDAVAGLVGFVGSKALNGITKNIKFIQDKPIMLPVLKLGLGWWAHNNASDPFLRNAGLGVMIEGGSNALEALAPNVFKNGLFAGASPVGSIGTVIDLDTPGELSGVGDDMNVEHAVAGTFGPDEVSGMTL